MTVATAISYFVTQAIVTEHHIQHGIGAPGALRVVVGNILFLTVLGTMCVRARDLGAQQRRRHRCLRRDHLRPLRPGRHPASNLNDAISPYLPLNAGTGVATYRFENSHHLSPWGGFALFCGYTLFILVGAAITLLRRDA